MRDRNGVVRVLAALVLGACGSSDADRRTPAPAGACDLFASVACLDGARMKADVDHLASPALGGRRAGREGNLLAAERLEAALAEAGLAKPGGRASYRQDFGLDDWRPTAAPSLAIGGGALALGTAYELVDFSGSGTTAGAILFAGYGLVVPPYRREDHPTCPVPEAGWDDYGGLDATGRVVLLLSGSPPGFTNLATRCPLPPQCAGSTSYCYTRSQRVDLAAERGGAGVLFTANPRTAASAPYPFLQLWGASVPVLNVHRDALAAVLADLPGWAAAVDALTPSPRLTSIDVSLSVQGTAMNVSVPNVIGVVPGTDPSLRDEIVVVGAHFDHMGKLPFRETYYPGADDNASGTAVVLELARAVAASATRPNRTLVFAFWNAEEWGLYGSWHYTHEDPIYPLASTVAAFSVDMVGRGGPGLDLFDAGLDAGPIVSAAQRSATALGLEGPIAHAGPEYGSDHRSFTAVGVPGVLAMTADFADHTAYHTPEDSAETVPEAVLSGAARLVWAAVRPWALGTERAPASASR
jgi:hypothetical protein